MAAITFVLWDGAGNVPPTLAVAEELAERGHDVDVLGHASAIPIRIEHRIFTDRDAPDGGTPAERYVRSA